MCVLLGMRVRNHPPLDLGKLKDAKGAMVSSLRQAEKNTSAKHAFRIHGSQMEPGHQKGGL